MTRIFPPDGSTLFFSTTGLLNSASHFADIWEVPLLEVKPTELKIERFTK